MIKEHHEAYEEDELLETFIPIKNDLEEASIPIKAY